MTNYPQKTKDFPNWESASTEELFGYMKNLDLTNKGSIKVRFEEMTEKIYESTESHGDILNVYYEYSIRRGE